MTNRIATTIIALLLSLGLPACEVDTQPMPDDGGWVEGEEDDGDSTETGTPPDLRPEPYDPNDLTCCTCIGGYSGCLVVPGRQPTDLECLQWVLDNKGSTEPFSCQTIIDDGTYGSECDFTCEYNA